MNKEFLEQYFQSVILPLYGDALDISSITWKDHGKVGPDAWAHYFDDKNGREYALLYENFPGSEYLNDELTHEIIRCGEKTSIQISSHPESTIDNIIGYFTLYAEKA